MLILNSYKLAECIYAACNYKEMIHSIAAQAWCLGRFLPLLLGDLVQESDKNWEVYLIFLRIMEYTFAPVITTDKLGYLQMLIQDFLTEFTHLYPDRPLTPKMHYLVHMPSWMKRLVYNHNIKQLQINNMSCIKGVDL